MEDGHDEEEVFDYMKKEKPIFIFLADIGDFIRMVYKPGEGVGNISGFVENILEKGSLHHIPAGFHIAAFRVSPVQIFKDQFDR